VPAETISAWSAAVDRAILLLLARMGLRAGDIVGLGLGDIDWQQAWIHVSGKGRRQTRLPMTQEVGDRLRVTCKTVDVRRSLIDYFSAPVPRFVR